MAQGSPSGKAVGKARRVWRITKLTFLAVLAVLALIILFQNLNVTPELSVLFWTRPMPLYLALLIALGVGFVAGLIVAHLLRGKRQEPGE